MHSQIVERTPSVYFKFDDQGHINYSKSSLAFEYSISNHKLPVSSRVHRVNLNSSSRQEMQQRTKQTPGKYSFKKRPSQDQFMALYGPKNTDPNKIQPKLKTEQFFQEFQQNFIITFDYEDDTFVNSWSPDAPQQSSKICKGNLNFQEFQLQESMKFIEINSKDITKNQHIQIVEMPSQDSISFSKTDQRQFQSQIYDSKHSEKTQQKNKKVKKPLLEQTSSGDQLTDKQNNTKVNQSSFQELISFGPMNKAKMRKYRGLHSRNFVTRDFQNNSSLLSKSRPIVSTKRRIPLKNIQDLVQNVSKERNRSQTRRKPIINTDLLISTVNKTQKSSAQQTNCVWSNPISRNKKSSSLQCKFNYDNMFKTNAFRQTLKSTTLQNWKKKYHMKIQTLGEKRTVVKKQRNTNIFNNLFIRA